MGVRITLNKGRLVDSRVDTAGVDNPVGEPFRRELVHDVTLYDMPGLDGERSLLARLIWNGLCPGRSYGEPYCRHSTIVLGCSRKDLEDSLLRLEGVQGADGVAYALKRALDTFVAGADTLYYLVFDDDGK